MSMAFLDEFMQAYGGQASRSLSASLGIKKASAAQIIPAVVPMILGGLKRQMETQGGAARIDHILNKYGSDSVLDDIAGAIGDRAGQAADAQLGGLLGSSGLQATDMIARRFKLDPGVAAKIIPALAPLILGALTQKKNASADGLGGIAALLDRDGDGGILDDVAGMLFQGSSSSSSGGGLGKLLGGLFGGRR
ncbi:MAG TPA: DUF937 domain-containing protein [Candidatus Aminicenantes bacterium]|nr:MAG: hypothetical protein BWX98_02366 [Candidatus Aminicenantes bacterium ADurb.Bin147]HPL14922.1 DUF937 domain-containing protein [Candidatus Aminicenantes bacterium]